MGVRRGQGDQFSARAILACVATGFIILIALAAPVQASLLPEGFFDITVKPGSGAAAVEADRLSYDGVNDTISAEGSVVMSWQGFVIRADRLVFDQRTSALNATGNVAIAGADGTVFQMDTVEVTGGFKEAFVQSLTLTTAEGSQITARDAKYSSELATVLTEATYSPCGLCVDEKGRKIGWRVKAARMVYDREKASVTMEQPTLELLGIPVAWLPWLSIPDPTQPRRAGVRMPSIDYDEQRGGVLTVPYFVPVSRDVDLLLTPTLMTRQGALMGGSLKWRVPRFGTIDVRASGLYQLDKSAFAGEVGERDWRGAAQIAGRFTPTKEWTVGGSYTVFTDHAYTKDYKQPFPGAGTNEAYATYLTTHSWLDMRVQKFTRLGNYDDADDATQAMVLPKVQFDHVQQLGQGFGQVSVNGTLLGVRRDADQSATYGGVPYDFGYAGNKVHGMIEGAWQNQYILPGGIAATPYLGARLDGAWYDGSSGPSAGMLFNATPIAAMDFRWPLLALNGADTHLLEPIAQLVWRGSSTSAVGITNDDAQSFVFDTSNLFDYNRFSGIDREETGLRANLGGHYLANFADDSWLDFVAGQSFQLLGPNALGTSDQVQVGTHTGLGDTASFVVASVTAGSTPLGVKGGAKVQIDPSKWSITRGQVGGEYTYPDLFTVGADYIFIKADPLLGTVADQHELAVRASAPVPYLDYWTVNGGATFDLAKTTWTKANAGITYDDGYLMFGGTGNITPSSYGFGVRFGLKGPDGSLAF